MIQQSAILISFWHTDLVAVNAAHLLLANAVSRSVCLLSLVWVDKDDSRSTKTSKSQVIRTESFAPRRERAALKLYAAFLLKNLEESENWGICNEIPPCVPNRIVLDFSSFARRQEMFCCATGVAWLSVGRPVFDSISEEFGVCV